MTFPIVLGVCIAAGGCLVGLWGLRRGIFFSPGVLYAFSHSLAFSFSIFPLFGMKVKYTPEFLGYMCVAHAMFYAGLLAGRHFTRRSVSGGGEEWRIRPSWRYALFGLSMAMMAVLVVKSGGLPMLSGDPEGMRAKFVTGYMAGLFFAFNVAVLYLLMQSFLSNPSFGSLMLVLPGLVLVSLSGSRAYVIMVGVAAATRFELRNRKAGLKIVVIGLAVFAFFLLMGYFRYIGSNGTKAIGIHAGAQLFFVARGAYQYLSNGYWNWFVGFGKYLSGEVPLSFGLGSFSGLFYWFSKSYTIQKAMGWDTLFNESIMMVPGLNSVTYVWNFIKDFGLLAGLLLPAVAGGLLQVCYRRAKEGRLQLLLYPFLAHQTLLSFNTFWPAEGFMSLTFLVICLVMWLGVEGNDAGKA